MRKVELIAFGLLIILYFNKIFFHLQTPLFSVVNIILFLFLIIFGLNLYRVNNYNNKFKAIGLAIFCGIAFGFGIISFGSKIWNHSNLFAFILALPNIILFLFVLFKFIKNKQGKHIERAKYYKGLLIRSTIIFTLFLIVLPMSYQFINLNINKDHPVFYNRGLSYLYIETFNLNLIKLCLSLFFISNVR